MTALPPRPAGGSRGAPRASRVTPSPPVEREPPAFMCFVSGATSERPHASTKTPLPDETASVGENCTAGTAVRPGDASEKRLHPNAVETP